MHPLIDQLKLQPHPEGGYFREIYRSELSVDSPTHGQKRSALTGIYFLLLQGQVSRFHRVQHDEVWHHYEGAPLRLIDGIESISLGDPQTIRYQHTIKAGSWQAAESLGEYTLVGCNVAPGFDFADFSFMSKTDAENIREHHPNLARFI